MSSGNKFKFYARADSFRLENAHVLYRVHAVPGLRDSDAYGGTGIKKTYDLADTEKDYPDDEDAAPVLRKIRGPNGVTASSCMSKEVKHATASCPDCGVAGVVEPDKAERFCPQCGLLLGRGDEVPAEEHAGQYGPMLSRDPQDAGRLEQDEWSSG